MFEQLIKIENRLFDKQKSFERQNASDFPAFLIIVPNIIR